MLPPGLSECLWMLPAAAEHLAGPLENLCNTWAPGRCSLYQHSTVPKFTYDSTIRSASTYMCAILECQGEEKGRT
ncbi:hypothetical protein DENSPDRAFT_661535 [Dentipellis sp. KUC8613]|nr:hypothetical protein DENSPDRAFT_661535 [Dentipellis sp. KUC8613]